MPDPLYPPKGSKTPPSAISPGSVVSLPSLVRPVPRGREKPSDHTPIEIKLA